jgi:hypothetical protein
VRFLLGYFGIKTKRRRVSEGNLVMRLLDTNICIFMLKQLPGVIELLGKFKMLGLPYSPSHLWNWNLVYPTANYMSALKRPSRFLKVDTINLS